MFWHRQATCYCSRGHSISIDDESSSVNVVVVLRAKEARVCASTVKRYIDYESSGKIKLGVWRFIWHRCVELKTRRSGKQLRFFRRSSLTGAPTNNSCHGITISRRGKASWESGGPSDVAVSSWRPADPENSCDFSGKPTLIADWSFQRTISSTKSCVRLCVLLLRVC